MATAFQPSAFQNNAFQIDGGVPPVVPPSGGGFVRPKFRIVSNIAKPRMAALSAAFIQEPADWHAVLDYNDDDLALKLMLDLA